MSIKVTEEMYRILRNNDPSYQAMTRITDVNNVYDVHQQYILDIKNKNIIQNDFQSQLDFYNNNKGILHDSRIIDKRNFFKEAKKMIYNGKEVIAFNELKYFKFKSNAILRIPDELKHLAYEIKDSYEVNLKIKTTIEESIEYYLVPSPLNPDVLIKKQRLVKKEIITLDPNANNIEPIKYSSNPLMRNDLLIKNELAHLFVYIDGIKIPDTEVYIYSTTTGTDIFIPEKYISVDIHNPIDSATNDNFKITIYFDIDCRQPGKESLYINERLNGNVLIVDLNDVKHKYKNKIQDIKKEQIVLFINGFLYKINSFEKDNNNILTVKLPKTVSKNDMVELYILHDILYRYNSNEETTENNGSHFFIEDNYKHDVLNGPITKQAISFFYNKKRINDDFIKQTSRFSFKYDIDIENFDESKVDFFIEDIDTSIKDNNVELYGDDYYLLNMLGVKRCVDLLKGKRSYSIFDKERFKVNVNEVLSKNTSLFDIYKSIDKYNKYENEISHTDERIKSLIKDNPSLLRVLLEQFKLDSFVFTVIGNEEDVSIGSLYPRINHKDEFLYKIYVNNKLIPKGSFTIKRSGDKDIIIIKKDIFDPLVKSPDGTKIISGINTVDIQQYNVTYKDKTYYKDRINYDVNNTSIYDFRKIIINGEEIYEKTYKLENLPFDENISIGDIYAIESINRDWFDTLSPEYYNIYPSDEYKGFRLVKSFKISKLTSTEMTIQIALHDYLSEHTNSEFILLINNFNTTEIIEFKNDDKSFMIDNDLIIPIYSSIIEYENIGGQNVISNVIKYVPYITDVIPIVSIDEKELVYLKDFSYQTQLSNDGAACSYLILYEQPRESAKIEVQFISNNIKKMLLKYINLNIDNRYGLVYLSQLKFPISSSYIDIVVNDKKMNKFNIDILSDKLIRIKNIERPIKSINIITNMKYNEIDLNEYISYYKESDFEKTLSEIFNNCDPAKNFSNDYPNIDHVYKMNPYYSEFVHNYTNNPKYKSKIDHILANKYNYTELTKYESVFPSPDSLEPEDIEIHKYIKLFFEIYRWNHGFYFDVDSIQQQENSSDAGNTNIIYENDVLEVMFLNWLCCSGKTGAITENATELNPIVTRYFSIFEPVIINDRLDIVIDSSKIYKGLRPDAFRGMVETTESNEIIIPYPGTQVDLKRKYFYAMVLKTLIDNSNKFFDDDSFLKELINSKYSNILYPVDFPLEPDKDGIMWTGTNIDIVF